MSGLGGSALRRHLLQFARWGAIALVIWGLHGASVRRRAQSPAKLAAAREFFPAAARLLPPTRAGGWSAVLDADGRQLGWAVCTSPEADDLLGYAGPVPALVAAGLDERVLGVGLLPNRETPANVRAITEYGFLDSWNDQPWQEAADLKADAVSGSTSTCAAVTAGVRRRLRLAAGLDAPGRPAMVFSWREALSALVLAAALLVGFWPRLARRSGVRLALQLPAIAWLGFWATSFLSLALLAGWAADGVPWRALPMVALMAVLAGLLPVFTGRQFYCTHLCPHGAAQELVARVSRWKRPVPERLGRVLALVPGLLLGVMVALVILGIAVPLEPFEPFSAYLRSTAWISLGLALVGLAASLFVARAWCRYGCATGALLRFLRRPGKAEGPGYGDGLLGVLAALALAARLLA